MEPQTLLEQLPVGVLATDDAVVITYANKRFLEAFHCTSNDVLRHDFIDLIAPSDRRSAIAFDRALNRAQTKHVDRLVVLKIEAVEQLVRAKLQRNGKQWLVLVGVLDSEDNAVYSLYMEQIRWSAAIRKASDAMVIIAEDNSIVDFNERFFSLVEHRSDHGVLVGEDALRGTNLFAIAALGGDTGQCIRKRIGDHAGEPTSIAGRWFEIDVTSLRAPRATAVSYALIFRDITDRRDSENERMLRQHLKHQNEIIEGQRQAIRELSSPLLPIAHDVLVIPFIGSLEHNRVHELIDNIMAGVAERGAKVVILDLTGVPTLDRMGAHGLVQAAQALRLIGAQTILSGLNANLAILIVEAKISLGHIDIRANLQDAVAAVMKARA
ncbi:MAG: STAS domain-containing protein [Nannocystaceae bacterium]